MPRFSLIEATINRTEEFALLLRSLTSQEKRDFELIVVDQNPDDRLLPILDDWSSKNVTGNGGIQVRHLHCVAGVSRARNLGIMHSSGEILCFPDDDCWYRPDTLQKVDEWFRQNCDYGILSVGSRDERGRISGNRWVQKECDLNGVNVFRTSATYTYFIRRPPDAIPLRFDESIGPASGTPFGCGEDTDLLLCLMGHGIRGRFCSKLSVGHPSKGFMNVHRAEQYGGGFGRVLAKYSRPAFCFVLIAFDISRVVSWTLLGNRTRATHLWAHAKGMASAYFAK